MACRSPHSFALGLIAVLAFAATGAAHAKRHLLRTEIDGIPRSALLYAPDDAGQQPLPLILVFHGRGDSYDKFASAVKLHRDWPGAIVVYPQGLFRSDYPSMRGWQYRVGTDSDRDLKLTDWLLAEIGRRYTIAAASTYAAGFSNGGHFVLLLMAERSEAFAAFVAIGVVQPKYAAASVPRPLLYLFGRDEDPDLQQDWIDTVKALARHNHSTNAQTAYLACCQLLQPGADGAAFAYGRYNAGHIWPHRGNEWLIEFLSHP